ncbi:DUF2489 domain-containing protein [uncultured Ferrimonas sp.]|uniref:DUF2489 domain-containing protein n=1 Tax=uncultured Ferrimonas sp. TaxID=432640 RepID=UPI00261FB3BE|nr:DUF2489 domain-containing protein [uncultured Ferrimonas sp.]
MSLQGSLLLAALIVIAALSAYAIKLWRQVAEQQRQRDAKISERQLLLQDQIQQIAKAAEAEQCQAAEAALRLVNLLRAIPGTEQAQLAAQFPHLHALYDAISDQPILEARKALDKKERRRLDRELELQQSKLGPAIAADLAILTDASWSAKSLQQ